MLWYLLSRSSEIDSNKIFPRWLPTNACLIVFASLCVGLHGRMILQIYYEINKNILNQSNYHINLNPTVGYILSAFMRCNSWGHVDKEKIIFTYIKLKAK